jgi:hypothetical protein
MSQQILETLNRLEEMVNTISNDIQDLKEKNANETLLHNAAFLKRMSISKRTAQSWRDEGIISFSQIGSKIYYKMSDVEKMLDKNHRAAFKK